MQDFFSIHSILVVLDTVRIMGAAHDSRLKWLDSKTSEAVVGP